MLCHVIIESTDLYRSEPVEEEWEQWPNLLCYCFPLPRQPEVLWLHFLYYDSNSVSGTNNKTHRERGSHSTALLKIASSQCVIK